MKLRKNFYLIWMVGLLITPSFSSALFAGIQEHGLNQSDGSRTISGTVRDETGIELPGVNIIIKGTTTGTQTDIFGNYSLTVPSANTIIQFSFLGYETVERIAGDEKTINVDFQLNTSELEEVVVVGFGTQRKVSVVGSISTVEMSSLESVSTPSISNALGGQMPGIITRQTMGEPGYDQAAVYIRGMGTWTNRSPLVLVDGIERDMNTINTQEIESISVLKDASATAVYGVRGANGVILINTKSGKQGKPKVTLRSEVAILTPLRLPKYIDGATYAELINESRWNIDPSIEAKYSPEDIELYRNGSDPYFHPNTNWMDEVLKKNTMQTIHNLSIAGGTDILKYYVNVGYTMQDGMYKTDNLNDYNTNANTQRYNFRSKIDINLSKSVEVSLGIGGIVQMNNYPGKSSGDVFWAISTTSPIAFPKQNPDGSPGGITSWLGSNPWGMLTQSGYSTQNRNTLQSTFSVKWDLSELVTKGLSVTGKFSYDHYSRRNTNRTKDFEVKQYLGQDPETGEDMYNILRQPTPLGYGGDSESNRVIYFEAVASYDRTFNEHSFNGMLLYNQRDYVDLTAGSSIQNLPFRRMGFASRLSYSYDYRYLLEFNMGYNGSENFPPGSKFGFFPSVSLGWVPTSEKFWNIDAVSNLKVRGSFGRVGNDDIGGSRFLFLTTMNTRDAQSYRFGIDAIEKSGIQEAQIGNPNVTWETSDKLNLGVDFGFLNNSLIVQLDAFKEWRKGILIQRQTIPTITGYFPWVIPYGNLGKTENKGLEALVEYKKQVGKDFFFSLRGNISFARNKIIENDEPDQKYAYQSAKGRPIDQRFGLVALGFFKDEEEIANSPRQTFQSTVRPGDIKYLDVNNDGVIDKYDEVALGYPRTPELMFGFGGTVAYKKFDLSVYFTGAGRSTEFLSGDDVYAFRNGEGTFNISEEYYNNRWTSETASTAKYPLVVYGESPNNYRTNTIYMRDARYLRLKNAEIGYNWRSNGLRNAGVESIRFFVNGINLLTFDKLKIRDPETGGGALEYPIQRTFNTGLQVNF